MKKRIAGFLILGLLTAFLSGCGNENSEIATMVPTETCQETSSLESHPKIIHVHTIDEFLAALNSNVRICLEEGTFHLDQAADYGMDSDNPAYYWEPMGDGYQLVLNHLHDLIIEGTGKENTCLMHGYPYANVLTMDGCKRIHLEGFTAGHEEQGQLCTGGVLALTGCEEIDLQNMGLFGCGIRGLDLYDCSKVRILDSDVYDCSLSGLEAHRTGNLKVENTNFYTIGSPKEPGMFLFSLIDCLNAEFFNCSISENNVMQLLDLSGSQNVCFQNTEFRANRVTAFAFQFQNCQPVFDHCSFEGNDLRRWYESTSMMAANENGELIGDDQLPEVSSASSSLPAQITIEVSTADEFLKALGSDRKIILAGKELDLSTASDFGSGSSPYYYWEESYDGPALVIANADNLTICAQGTDRKAHSITALPRYANVLSFRRCSNITLEGFTAGHAEIPGECTGGVLDFQDSDQIWIENCGLFGCGILGVNGQFCSGMQITNCDIYDCSFGGISLWSVDSAVIKGNSFRDLGGPSLMTQQCEQIESDTPTNLFPQ